MPEIANPIQVQKFLKGVNYPCSRKDLVETARREGADENVVHTLQSIPDQTYNGPSGVAEAIGKLS
jgi:hypothetical protein